MGPPKKACEMILNVQIELLRIIKRVREIKDKIKSIIEMKGKLKYGFINLMDVIGAEMLAAIASIAASAAQAVFGAISGIAATFLEAILSSILKILLAHPTAIFSLVAIPHSQAIKATQEERMHLEQARRNLRTILYIILKWTKGPSGRRYYDQIKNALPYIRKAIDLSYDLLNDLGGDNSQFNESKYRTMQLNIEKAIEITKPQSIIDTQFQVTRKVEANRERYYQEKAHIIDIDYKKQRKELANWYRQETTELNQEGDNLQSAVKAETIRNQYAFKRKAIDTERKIELHKAQLDATARSLVDKSAYVKAVGGVASEFVEDVRILGINLREFVDNAKSAYKAHMRSQNLCNTIYEIRNLIIRLIDQIITLLRKVSNASAEIAIKGLETAQSMLEVAEKEFVEVTADFEDPSAKISSIQLSTTNITGHGLLVSADAILSGTITDSLIDLINSDDVLGKANVDFENFTKELEKIPDWDGALIRANGRRVSRWATNPSSSAISPYIQMIADATTILGKVPILALSNTVADREKVTDIIKSVNKTFRVLFTHNSKVADTLYSYRPYMTSEAGNLMRILSKAGNLLDGFALTLSLTTLITDITLSMTPSPLDDTVPTYANCRIHYPELYKTPEAREAVTMAYGDLPAKESDLSYIDEVERKAEERESLKNQIKYYPFNIPEEELKGSLPEDWG